MNPHNFTAEELTALDALTATLSAVRVPSKPFEPKPASFTVPEITAPADLSPVGVEKIAQAVERSRIAVEKTAEAVERVKRFRGEETDEDLGAGDVRKGFPLHGFDDNSTPAQQQVQRQMGLVGTWRDRPNVFDHLRGEGQLDTIPASPFLENVILPGLKAIMTELRGEDRARKRIGDNMEVRFETSPEFKFARRVLRHVERQKIKLVSPKPPKAEPAPARPYVDLSALSDEEKQKRLLRQRRDASARYREKVKAAQGKTTS